MKTHTSNLKNTVKRIGRVLDSKITYTLNNEEIVLGMTDLNSVTPSYTTSLLKSVMKQLDIDSNVEIPEGTIINYQFGVLVNGSFEYLNYGNYVVYKVEKQEDVRSYKITCYDKMLYAMKDYEAMNITYPITIRNYIGAVATHLGLTFASASDTFANYDKEIANELYLDSDGNSLGYTFRDVLDELAQVTASNICINEETDELEVRYISDTSDTINEEFFKDINVTFGEKFGPVNSIVLSRAGGSDNVYLQDEESVELDGLCEIKISDNQVMNWNDRSDYLPDILDQLDGLEYYINDYSSTGIFYYNVCDRYNASIDGNSYSCVMFNDEVNITQGAEEIIHTDMPDETETEYTKADKTDRKINQTYLMVDKQNGRIDALASSVHDLTDFLKTVQGTGSITLENTTASNGAIGRLEITGITEIGLYPGMAYPSDKVYPSKLTSYIIVQENEDGTEHYETYIDLGFPLISTDKLIIENGKVSVKRVNSNINTNIEVILKTFEGETNISVKFFDNVNIKCEYIEKNEFTKYFATEAELSSSIIITDEQISSKVSKAEVISEINQSAEQIQINADKISLEGKAINLTTDNIVINSTNFSVDEDGKITGTAGDIAGFEIDADNGFVKKIYAPYDYTEDDFNRVRGILRGQISPTEDDYIKYDFDENGEINSSDLLCLNLYLINGITTTSFGQFIITAPPNTKNLYNAKLGYIDAYGSLRNGFTPMGANFSTLTIKTRTSDTQVSIGTDSIKLSNNDTGLISMSADTGNITCVSLTQTSKEESKKNFEKLNNAKDILQRTDIYKYNLKTDTDDDKKHIGFVIGDEYNYSEEITSKDNDGVDVYSMVSVLWQVVKEQQEEIDKLKEMIKNA